MRFRIWIAAAACGVILHPASAAAQLRASVVVSGLTQPVAVVQAPGFTLRGGTTEILRGIVARELGVR